MDAERSRWHRVRRTPLLGALVLAAAITFALAAMVVQSLSAAGGAQLAVSPGFQAQFWFKTPTPMTFTINASSFSGAGLTPVAGYQYGLQWDPNILTWMSGPKVGPGTPTPAAVLPCSNAPQIITWGTPTATPTNWVPTFTPTSTNTPLTTTPTNTPTKTFTPTATPTPGGYIEVACATILGVPTPLASGVIGTFTFMPHATQQESSPLKLINVVVVDANATPIATVVVNGKAQFIACNDLNGDGLINALDLNVMGKHFLTSTGQPNFLPIADLNGDGAINALDLNYLGATFLMAC